MFLVNIVELLKLNILLYGRGDFFKELRRGGFVLLVKVINV